MKIAITGASGHVGINLVNEMINLGHELRVLIYNDNESLAGVKVEKVAGSLSNVDSLSDLCNGMEVVIHLAALITIGSESKEKTIGTNIEGTKNIVNAARNAGVKKLIHFSSIHALNHYPLDTPMDESRSIAIDSKIMYERTKAIAEDWVLKQNSNDFCVVVINPTSIIGPFDIKPSLMGDLMLRIYKHSIPGVVPGGYDWVDVRDIVDATISAIENGRGGERYILSGSWLSIKSFADLFVDVSDKKNYLPVIPLWLARFGVPFLILYSRLINQKPLYTFESLNILQSGNRNISSAKAQLELGFKSRPLENTLSDTYKWFKENNYI